MAPKKKAATAAPKRNSSTAAPAKKAATATRKKKDDRVWYGSPHQCSVNHIDAKSRVLPVNPCKLLGNLAALDMILPVLQPLRLCHAFGRGPDVHITKLPIELIRDIEQHAYDRKLDSHEFNVGGCWDSYFKCFQGQCQPHNHVNLFNDHLWDWKSDLWNGEMMTPCDKCEKCEDSWEACASCQEDFDFLCDEETVAKDRGWITRHDVNSCKWADLIDSFAEENFRDDGYIQRWPLWDEPAEPSFYGDPLELLRKRFGLDAQFFVAMKGHGADVKWPEHKNHDWYEDDGLQTTICLLKLPKPDDRTMMTRSMKGKARTEQTPTSQRAMLLSPEAIARRFQRALNMLRIQPFVHESQANALASYADAEVAAPASIARKL